MTTSPSGKRHWPAWLAMVAMVLAVAMVAAACGGDDDDGAEDADGEAVSGELAVTAVWSGAEQESFQAVIDGFTADNPDVTVNYTSAGDQLPTVLSTAVEGGNPPDIAMIPQPGLIRQFAEGGDLAPIEFAREDLEANFAAGFVEVGEVEGELYGILFKAANKSLGWYNVGVFEDAGVEPPASFEELSDVATTIQASGVTPYSVGADVGWPLTDLFENIYLRTAGPEMYDQLATHEIPWTDPSVIEALEEMRTVIGEPDLIAGGRAGALETDFPGSVTQVFTDPPDAGIVFEGDFVAGVILDETSAEAGTGFDLFPFPAIGDSPPVVVTAGDTAVMFRDSPAAQAFMRYLASPEAAQIWAERGGFLSANQNVDTGVYPDDITRDVATALVEAETSRFDMSDLQPAAFGGTAGQGMWGLFTDYLRDPSDPEATARQLEQAAARAFG